MRAGKLDRTIIIQRQVETTMPSGDVTFAWTNIATVHAELVERLASEIFTGFGEAEDAGITFRMRHLPGITTADRILFEATAFGIKKVTEIGRRRGLELRAVAQR